MTAVSFVPNGFVGRVAAASVLIGALAVWAGFSATPALTTHAESSIAVLAVDADSRGNGPRTVGTVDDCVSASVDEEITVDVVIPDPGVPDDRGITAFALSVSYDPAVVTITGDSSTEMLLDQASGSNPLPIQDLKPDTDGSYMSWAVDFGPSGIEPEGTSETGPGVMARFTVMAHGSGTSQLFLSSVDLRDDEQNQLLAQTIHDGTIAVGQPCPGQQQEPSPQAEDPAPTPSSTATPTRTPMRTPSPSPSPTATPEPAAMSHTATASPTPEPVALAVQQGPRSVPNGGGAPPPAGSAPWPLLLGAGAILVGTGLLRAGVRRRPAE